MNNEQWLMNNHISLFITHYSFLDNEFFPHQARDHFKLIYLAAVLDVFEYAKLRKA